MAFAKYLVIAAIVAINLCEINAHGRLMDPVNRGSAFRKGFPTPENWDDDGNYCGGYTAHFEVNKGKCGVCGDNFSDKQPRPNENGGIYGTGTIVKTYKAESEIEVDVELTANHWGYFDFSVCPLKSSNDIETEECFNNNKLELVNGGNRYQLKSDKPGHFFVKLRLPKGLRCEHCSLRWNYVVANSWGICEDGSGAIGCGDQETFRTCSDIKIE